MKLTKSRGKTLKMPKGLSCVDIEANMKVS